MNKKTILVTGGAGFVGSHLCERLAREGNRVISLDNYFTGSRANHVPGVEYREGHTKDIERLVSESLDIVYHLGEYARVEQSVLEPDVVFDLNTIGTRAVVEFWVKKRFKLVYAGSSTKFGDGGAARHTSPYARTKAENSELIRVTGEEEALPYAITYFYNVYGPRERSGVYGTVIEHFKRMYRAGTPCAIVRPGTQERNFTHVDDIVDGLLLVGEKGHGDEYGLGNERAYSIFEVAEFFGFGESIVLFPERHGNRMTSGLNTEKIRALGWSPRRSLPEYIGAFTKDTERGQLRDKRVLMFSTTMHPIAGLAEESFAELAQALPDVRFDVVTARFSRKGNAALSSNVTVHPIGFGVPFDKFLLPFLGPLKALSLKRAYSYLFAWSLMASYAALAGALFKSLARMPLLITLADQNVDDVPFLQRFFLSLSVSSADQVYGTHSIQEQKAIRLAGTALPRNTLGEGDAFANALRFAYADTVRTASSVKERSKKTLIFSLAYHPHIGGAEIAIKEITDRIPDIEFHLITNRYDSTLPKIEKIGNILVHRIGFASNNPTMADLKRFPLALNKYLFQVLAPLHALSLHKKHRYDALWAMMAHATGIAAAVFTLFAPKIKYLLTLQEGDPPEYVERLALPAWPLFSRAFTRADIVQAISHFLGEWARRRNFTGPLEIIPNAVDLARFETAPSESAVNEVKDRLEKKMGDVFLITTSRLVHKNAVDDVLRALPKLPGNVHFVILGTGPDEKKLKSLARKLKVAERVRFLGHVGHEELPLYLRASDIFIRPSRSEGMGNSFIEAMASDLPVIATQEGGIADFLFDEKRNPDMPITGWAVDKDSPKEIAEAVTRIMREPEKVRAVIRTAHAMVQEKYSWDLIAQDMKTRVFDKVLENGYDRP